MKYLICGDRKWDKVDVIRREMEARGIGPGDIVIEGEARGADIIARHIALGLGAEVHPYPAEWNKYGRAAGSIRNQVMLDQQPDEILAFHSDIENSKGTADMVRRARKARITTHVYSN